MDARMDERTHKRTHDGHNAMTIARWPLANGAKNMVGNVENSGYMHFLLFYNNYFKDFFFKDFFFKVV